jgi:RimJ/RimL family protein N-acetyltransferase
VAKAEYPNEIPGPGLTLRPWDMDLASQMAEWSPRGFPYHAFDLSHLRDPVKQAAAVASCTEEGRHRHFVAVEAETAVGRVSVNLRDPLGTYIWSVHVPPEHERRGVAKRMLATLMTYLEVSNPSASFVLTTNAYAEAAHRVYRALGFVTSETRWHFDREIAEALWRVTPQEREPVNRFIRFQSGRWQVRSHVMRRQPGTPMDLGTWAAVAS